MENFDIQDVLIKLAVVVGASWAYDKFVKKDTAEDRKKEIEEAVATGKDEIIKYMQANYLPNAGTAQANYASDPRLVQLLEDSLRAKKQTSTAFSGS